MERSNLRIVSNLWISTDAPDATTPWAAASHIPGELMIEFIQAENPMVNPRDTSLLKAKMTPKQIREYKDRRFFFSEGESGPAFDRS